MQLIGHYDSPFVRRVGVSLTVLGIPFERQLLSVFSNAEAVRAFNPLVRVPALVLEDLSVWAEAHLAFKACLPTPKEIGGEPQDAQAALLRLQGHAQSR
jgi:hypothetical protein